MAIRNDLTPIYDIFIILKRATFIMSEKKIIRLLLTIVQMWILNFNS